MAESSTYVDKPATPPGKETIRHRDLTQGSIVKNLLVLSWPMIIMEATYMISQIWDMFWVGRGVGSAAIAAVGVGSIITMMLSTIDMAIIAGARAMIARFTGARDMESAKKVAGQAFLMALCWGLVVTIFGSVFIRDLLALLGLETAVIEQGVTYLRILFAGWLTLEFLIMSLYTIQSTGDSFNPMVIEIFIRAIHMLLCPFLVMGYWFFPALGISGAAISNVIGQALGAVAGLTILFTGYSRIKLTLSNFRFVPNMAWRMIKIGFPSLISMLQMNFSMLLLTKIIAPFGTMAVAAQSLVGNIQGFLITPSLGLGGGVAVLVGQNLGAKQPERAVKSTWLGTAILEGFLVTCSIILLIWAESIVGIFDKDPAVITIGAAFLRISTIGYLVIGMNYALQNAIAGAGDTLPNMIVNVCMIWAIQIPLTYYLANHTGLGVYGIRWAMVISYFAGAIAFLLYFQSGRWKRKKV